MQGALCAAVGKADSAILEKAGEASQVTSRQHQSDVFYYMKMFYNPKRKHARNGMLSHVEFERRQKMRREGV